MFLARPTHTHTYTHRGNLDSLQSAALYVARDIGEVEGTFSRTVSFTFLSGWYGEILRNSSFAKKALVPLSRR